MPTPPVTPTLQQSSRQFGIARLMLWMVVVAVMLAAFLNGGATGTLSGTFTRMPPNDDALRAWYAQELGKQAVEIEREGNQLRISESRRFGFRYFSPPPPPWDKLGYSQPTNLAMSWGSTLFRFPIHLVVICLLAVIGDWWLKRQAKRKRSTLVA